MMSATDTDPDELQERVKEQRKRDQESLQKSIAAYRGAMRGQQPLMDQRLADVLGQKSVAAVRQQQGLGQAASQSGGNPWAMKQAGMGAISQTGQMRAGESMQKLDFTQGHGKARLGRILTEEETVNRAQGRAGRMNDSWNMNNRAMEEARIRQRNKMIGRILEQGSAVTAQGFQ